MKHSAEKLIEDHFRRGLSLTELQCINIFGRMRLASIVHRLRKKGMQIDGKKVASGEYFKYRLVNIEKKYL